MYRAFISRKRIETGGICDEEYYVCYGNDQHGKETIKQYSAIGCSMISIWQNVAHKAIPLAITNCEQFGKQAWVERKSAFMERIAQKRKES